MKKLSNKILIWLLSAALIGGLSGVTAVADESDDFPVIFAETNVTESEGPEAAEESDESAEEEENIAERGAETEESEVKDTEEQEPEPRADEAEADDPEAFTEAKDRNDSQADSEPEASNGLWESEDAEEPGNDGMTADLPEPEGESGSEKGMFLTIEKIDAENLPESDHNYANSADQSWTYSVENALNGIYVTFDGQTKVESGYDFITIYDGNGTQTGRYTGTELAGVTLYIPTATFTIRLTSDNTQNYYGFKVTAVEAAGDTVELNIVGSVEDPLSPVEAGAQFIPADVKVNGVSLVQDTDFTVDADVSQANEEGELTEVTITGIGKYSGTLITHVFVYDEEHLADGAQIAADVYTLLRLTENSSMGELIGVSTIEFEKMDMAYASSITEITLTPVETDENGDVLTNASGEAVQTPTKGAEYPNAPKEITITADAGDFYTDGNYVYFYRSEKDPVVYVMEGHGDPYIVAGRNGTVKTYPQTQVYQLTVKANGYKDVVGTTTYYTGTSPAFSIIIDTDGNVNTSDDRETVASWSADEIRAMSSFANGSSQCGMTGFRTFSTEGVSLDTLLKSAGIEVSEDDYFLLDTSDHYGNYFTFKDLFGTTRYFMSGIYDPGFADFYNGLGIDDSDAGYESALRRWLADYALKENSVIEPRICIDYNEIMIYGDELEGAVMPTEGNTTFNSLVSFENQFRFVYGISLVRDAHTVTFNSNGGSGVDSQQVYSHYLTSSENTTMWTSYWANSLVIFSGLGPEYNEPETGSVAAETIEMPAAPIRDGYVFAGWYTDEECTVPFSFTENDGAVDEDMVLYAKWIPDDGGTGDTGETSDSGNTGETGDAGGTGDMGDTGNGGDTGSGGNGDEIDAGNGSSGIGDGGSGNGDDSVNGSGIGNGNSGSVGNGSSGTGTGIINEGSGGGSGSGADDGNGTNSSLSSTASPGTSDPGEVGLWIVMLVLCAGVAVTAGICRKKKNA